MFSSGLFVRSSRFFLFSSSFVLFLFLVSFWLVLLLILLLLLVTFWLFLFVALHHVLVLSCGSVGTLLVTSFNLFFVQCKSCLLHLFFLGA